MAFRIVWSPQSLEDIDAIAEFIARDSSFYAESTVAKIFDTVESLSNHPQLGRMVPEVGQDNLRELFVFQYRIIYEIHEQEIHILTVVHGKRIFKPN